MRSPAATATDACWLFGTISPFFSTATRLPARPRAASNSAMVSMRGSVSATPLMKREITTAILPLPASDGLQLAAERGDEIAQELGQLTGHEDEIDVELLVGILRLPLGLLPEDVEEA